MSRGLSLITVLALACTSSMPSSAPRPAPDTDPEAFEKAPRPSPRLAGANVESLEEATEAIDTYFEAHRTHRVHVQLDRPLYRPGETVWIKSWAVPTADFAHPAPGQQTYELVNPRGQVVERKGVMAEQGAGTNDFVIPAGAPGGKWTLRVRHITGEVDERPFIVSSYQAPRIQKELEFVREAYGPGDTVEALVELRTSTGDPLADHPVRVLLQVDGAMIAETTLKTSSDGALLATGTLPERLRSGDGLLTVMVEDGGITESISRSVPIVLADAQLALFPEGGDLVAGVPSRVYVRSTNRHGEPADVEGVVRDDRGKPVASFRTIHDGLGRFAFTPEPGRQYTAHVTAPVGVETEFPLADPQSAGCVLRSFDDLESVDPNLRVGVRCTTNQKVLVSALLREARLDTAAVEVKAGKESVVYLTPPPERQDEPGAVRVTVFNEDRQPLAERVVYRNHGHALQIELTTDAETYGPRDEVIVDVKTTDPSGDPVAAELALSVVDDAVITLADDENGHMLTRLYLEPELVESPKDPAFYFDPEEPLAARAMDLVMGTYGYRRFEWRPVFEPPLPVTSELRRSGSRRKRMEVDELVMDMAPMDAGGGDDAFAELDFEEPMEEAEASAEEIASVSQAQAAPLAQAAPAPVNKPAPPPAQPMAEKVALADKDVLAAEPKRKRAAQVGEAPQRLMEANARFDRIAMDIAPVAPVRVFPAPDYRAGFTGTRTDFRDTVHWAPTVQTGAKGTTQVRFYLSDAVTAFRITAEGLGGGFAGHGEATFNSVLPVSVATLLPPAVSVGDRLELPITVTSTRSEQLDVAVEAMLQGETLSLAERGGGRGKLALDPAGADTFFVPINVGPGRETATLRLSATGGGLSDVMVRELDVVPAGFPQEWSVAGPGTATSQRFELELTDVVPHSLNATATWYPSPVASLITGMEGLIQTPGGCFEQTSSTNWPNVAILRYLDAHDGDPHLKVKSARALDVGYNKLTGYQVDVGGFETWGSGPGKEALSAFGLLQFADMTQVYDVDPAVLTNDVGYLLKQRDGNGGFRNTGESAHGYGSAPKPVLDGFITFALVETGHHEQLGTELAHQAEVGQDSQDPYVLALAARSLLKAKASGAQGALDRLVKMQAEDGSFPGAESSITRSYEANLLVESTALAALAMLEGGQLPGADRAVNWIVENRSHGGTWGATQATALALAALTEHAERSRVPRSDGTVQIIVNGEPMQRRAYAEGETEPLVLADWTSALRVGTNVIEVVQVDGNPLPFSVDVGWKAVNPASAPGAEVSLETSLATRQVSMGETVRLTARVANRLDRIVPSPIARIGLPAGLTAPTWQLQELQERGEIAFFETRPREVTLYWDGLNAEETHEVNLDLEAAVAGTFTGPASSAYPYYNDDEKAWTEGLRIDIAKP